VALARLEVPVLVARAATQSWGRLLRQAVGLALDLLALVATVARVVVVVNRAQATTKVAVGLQQQAKATTVATATGSGITTLEIALAAVAVRLAPVATAPHLLAATAAAALRLQ
jgi:hypothetical protein